jgi:hypothetical protein
MDAQAWRVQLAPGNGLVVRSGRAVLLALPKGDQQEAFVDALREGIDAVVRAESNAPGRRVARAVAGLVASADDDAVPPLAVAAATDDGLALLLVGDVEVEIAAPDGTVEMLSGRDASTWVDKVVRGEFGSVTAHVGAAAEVDPRSDFGGGAVSASGFRLLPVGTSAVPAAPMQAAPVEETPMQAAPVEERAPVALPEEPTMPVEAPPLPVADLPAAPVPAAPVPAAPPVMAPMPSAPFEAVSLTDPLPEEELPPLPVLGDQAGANDGAVQVQGINCSRGHFNDPTSIYCATCGISMVHQTHNLVPGPRPPLGVVVLDDGSVFPLNDDYVVGREPDNAEDVRAGRALALPLEDPDAMVSRVHAKILLQGWDVRIVDAHSSNGTFVAKPGEVDWTRLPADEPMTILPGTRITMGSRSLVFDSYRKH